MANQRKRTVDGNEIGYRYLKYSQEKYGSEFEEQIARRINDQAIWFSRDAYRVLPLAVPYAVRDPECRQKKGNDGKDLWGRPNERGLIRDDNSLIKSLVRSLTIASHSDSFGEEVYASRTLGRGFVAAHIWSFSTNLGKSRDMGQGKRTVYLERTFSFWPNLVWLPRDLASLTDYEETFVQPYMRALSRKIYSDENCDRNFKSTNSYIRDSWELLPDEDQVRQRIDRMINDVAVDNMNYFEPTPEYLKRRLDKIKSVAKALEYRIDKGMLPSEIIISSKYKEDPANNIIIRFPRSTADFLRDYANAVEEALCCYMEDCAESE